MSLLGNKKVGFLGAGKMAEAIFGGMISSGLIEPENLYVCALRDEHLKYLKDTYNVNTVKNDAVTNEGAVEFAKTVDVLILSVEPNSAKDILEKIADTVDELRPIVFSIMGGITMEFLNGYIKKAPVIRIMPNTPMLVKEGVAGIVLGDRASKEDGDLAVEIFSSVGLTYILTEEQLDCLTGVSGCGPAFAGMFIEALADGGVMTGLSRKMATELAAKTLIGTGKLVLEAGLHPEVLKDNVCTPGGGTIAGVKALEDGSFRGTVMDAVGKAVVRMREVGKAAEEKK